MTTVWPTSRAIRQQLTAQKNRNMLLEPAMTMGELMRRAVIVNGYESVDDDTRTLTLLEAADFEAFSELKIERNFFTFTRNAAYLFRFFEELSGELVRIESLDTADTYGDFAEHIEILKALLVRYRERCKQRRILERIFIPEWYRLHRAWVAQQGAIEVVTEGYLTNFELKLLGEMAEIIPVTLRFEATRYNLKMQEKLAALGMQTSPGRHYRLNISDCAVLEECAHEGNAKIDATALGERLLQCAFVKQKVFEMVNDGIDPEQIAIVLPDESFVPMLRAFDNEGNFNFAMGEPFESTQFVRRCNALMAYAEHPGVENTLRLERLMAQKPEAIRRDYDAVCDAAAFSQWIALLLEGELEAVEVIVHEELFYFCRLIPMLAQSSLRALLHLFINRVKARSIDDVRGGKVTVMGVLETRACRFEGVVIVDFNDAYVPHRSDKDLFINSAVRGRAGLPTTGEREALQKQFYYQLISHAKRVEIAYVASEAALPSRFLREMGIVTQNRYADGAWADLLFARHGKRLRTVPDIEMAYDFTRRPLSATALKTFLECRRRYYHRYVEGIRPHEMPREMPEEHAIGNALHDALRDVYTQQERFTDPKLLEAAVAKALAVHSGTTPLERFLQQLWLKKLQPFFANEMVRFDAVHVDKCEVPLSVEYRGLRLEGRIDRIDVGPNGLEVLDYKSGKYPLYTSKTVENATDFQLEFYTLLAGTLGKVARSAYYDLKTGAIVEDPTHADKVERLKGHLDALCQDKHFVFDLTDTLAECRFCAYAPLCKRENI